ncbi:MAG: TIGR02996 domain-containing protein [Gemmataceae bacterium]|nr:TIGR02996 domain-containing protein [Gemmataceae bacterium]
MHPTRFLQTILTRPDDDEPRLRYADWLLQIGNPLGEFIRLQCASHHREPEASTRARALLSQHHVQWSQTIGEIVDWCAFHRGFIEEIAITDMNLIKFAGRLLQHAPIRDIHMSNNGARLDVLPALPFLQHTLFLDISAQRLGDEGLEGLADAPLLAHVHGLNLGSSCITDQGLEALYDSTNTRNLRELYLNDNPITDDGIRQFVMSPLADQLERLDVRNTRISHDGIEALEHVLGEGLLH